MNAGQYEGLMAEMRQQSALMAQMVGLLRSGAGPADEYEPVVRGMAGEMRCMWVDEIGETHWVRTGPAFEQVAADRGWKRAYVLTGGR